MGTGDRMELEQGDGEGWRRNFSGESHGHLELDVTLFFDATIVDVISHHIVRCILYPGIFQLILSCFSHVMCFRGWDPTHM